MLNSFHKLGVKRFVSNYRAQVTSNINPTQIDLHSFVHKCVKNTGKTLKDSQIQSLLDKLKQNWLESVEGTTL